MGRGKGAYEKPETPNLGGGEWGVGLIRNLNFKTGKKGDLLET